MVNLAWRWGKPPGHRYQCIFRALAMGVTSAGPGPDLHSWPRNVNSKSTRFNSKSTRPEGALPMRMSVIGCGHLGATHAACMAEIGHQVLGVDIDQDKVDLLRTGRAWFLEPVLDEMLARHVRSGRLRFTTSFEEAAAFAPVHFLGVGTPGLPDS